MRGIIAFLGLLCLCAGSANAYVTDAPHNTPTGVKCSSCHTYSLWWTHSPTPDEFNDAVCNSCHTQLGYPNKIPHNWLSMEEMHNANNGEWTSQCVDCHDPHQQAQLDWLNDPAEDRATIADNLFLVQGIIDEVDDSGDNQTIITFNPAITLSGTGAWPLPASASPQDLTWESKNVSDRGLIFVHDTANLTNTYSVYSADNSTKTIVLTGKPDTPIVANDTFALIYGQLIKRSVVRPGDSQASARTVKFFDPLILNSSGGFVEPGSDTEGICQVCHTKTKYWLANGDVVDAARFPSPLTPPTDHNGLAPCTACHETALGFKPINADHTFIASTGTTCNNCHSDQEDVVLDTHKSRCDHCHTQPPFLVNAIDNATDKWPSSPHTDGDCTDCHNANLNGRDIAGDFTNHLNALDTDDNATNGFDGHAGQVETFTNCTDACHFHKDKDVITQIHTGTLTVAEKDPCLKCHQLSIVSDGVYTSDNTTMTEKGTYTGSGALTNGAANGPGDCSTCHTDKADNWMHHDNAGDHSGQVTDINSSLCSGCHLINGTPDPYINTIHGATCTHCHDSLTGALIGDAADGPGACIDCHGPDFFQHDLNSNLFGYNHYDKGAVTIDAACAECHLYTATTDINKGDNFFLVVEIHGINNGYPTNPDTTAICALCHDDQGVLVGSATGHTGHGVNDTEVIPPNTCITCHGPKDGHPYNTDHEKVDPDLTLVTAENGCDNCHTESIVVNVHNDNCFLCHTGLTSLSPMQPGVLRGGGCTSCHSSVNYEQQTQLTNNFFSTESGLGLYGHPNDGDHTGQLAGDDPDLVNSRSCVECHDGDIAWIVHFPTGTCSSCHMIDGSLDTSITTQITSIPTDMMTGKPPVTNNYCTDCHALLPQTPEFLSGSDTHYTSANADTYAYEAPQGTTSGTVLGTPAAFDGDIDTLIYSIIDGNSSGLFAIDPTSGAVSVTADIGTEELGVYILSVQVVDGNGGEDTATVTITLTTAP